MARLQSSGSPDTQPVPIPDPKPAPPPPDPGPRPPNSFPAQTRVLPPSGSPALPLRLDVVPQPATWHRSPGWAQREGRRRVWTRDPSTAGLTSFSSMRSCSSVRLGRMGPRPCWYLGWGIGWVVLRSCSCWISSRWSSPTRAHRGLGREEPCGGNAFGGTATSLSPWEGAWWGLLGLRERRRGRRELGI